jgi:hypothetical protein
MASLRIFLGIDAYNRAILVVEARWGESGDLVFIYTGDCLKSIHEEALLV